MGDDCGDTCSYTKVDAVVKLKKKGLNEKMLPLLEDMLAEDNYDDCIIGVLSDDKAKVYYQGKVIGDCYKDVCDLTSCKKPDFFVDYMEQFMSKGKGKHKVLVTDTPTACCEGNAKTLYELTLDLTNLTKLKKESEKVKMPDLDF